MYHFENDQYCRFKSNETQIQTHFSSEDDENELNPNQKSFWEENAIALSSTSSNNSILIDTKSNHHTQNLPFLILKNNCLFKSYLLVKLIQIERKPLLSDNRLYHAIEDKILLKIIEIILSCKSEQEELSHSLSIEKECGEIYTKLFAHLYYEFSRQNDKLLPEYYRQNEENLKGLIGEIDALINIKIKNDENEHPIKEKPAKSNLISNLFNKTTVLTSIKSYFSKSATENQLLNEAILSNFDQNSYERIFNKDILIRLEDMILNLIDRLLIQSQEELKIIYSSIHYLIEKNMLDINEIENSILELTSLMNLYKNKSQEIQEPDLASITTHYRKRKLSGHNSTTNNSVANMSSVSSVVRKRGRPRKVNKLNSEPDLSAKFDHDEKIKRAESKTSMYTAVHTATAIESDEENNDDSEYDENETEKEDIQFSDEEERLPTEKAPTKLRNNNLKSSIEWWTRFSPLSISVLKLPGIGGTYAKRLKERNFEKLGDLVHFYEKKCNMNEQKFRDVLKNTFYMKQDSIEKIISIIENYLSKKDLQ